jgi:hypothetical protein
MEEENKNNRADSTENGSDKKDDLIEKGKILADQAEDFVAENMAKIKSSQSYGKASRLFGKVSSFLDQQSDEFHSGEMGAKLNGLKDKAEVQADELLQKTKEGAIKLGHLVDQQIEALKGKKDNPQNQDGEGI